MSEEKLAEIQKKLMKIEKIGEGIETSTSEAPATKKSWGHYQQFQKACMSPENPNKPDSPSIIEVIEGRQLHPTERLSQCALEYRKFRNSENPVDGLIEEYKVVKKAIKKGEKNE